MFIVLHRWVWGSFVTQWVLWQKITDTLRNWQLQTRPRVSLPREPGADQGQRSWDGKDLPVRAPESSTCLGRRLEDTAYCRRGQGLPAIYFCVDSLAVIRELLFSFLWLEWSHQVLYGERTAKGRTCLLSWNETDTLLGANCSSRERTNHSHEYTEGRAWFFFLKWSV